MSSKHAVVKQLDGIAFAAKADSNHWVVIDGPESLGGSNAGNRPKELLLIALGGCTASDVASILRKKRVPLEGFEVHLEGAVRDEHPQVFTDIHIEYVFYGKYIKTADVERAIELSTTKYCSVSAMLRASVNITHSYRIEESKETISPAKAEEISAKERVGWDHKFVFEGEK
jgi:putative redox protein